LQNAKNLFIEAKIDKIAESVIPHQTLFQHQLGYVYHLICDKRHFLFWSLSKYKT